MSAIGPRRDSGSVSLRPVTPADLAAFYAFQTDPESNRMAVARPRSPEAFRTHWEQAMNDPGVVVRAIVVDETLAGSVACFKMDGRDSVGYWVDRAHWGRGVATRALGLFLDLVPARPLYATTAKTNGASIRVLEKCGFVVTGYAWSEETERFPACEEALLRLGGESLDE